MKKIHWPVHVDFRFTEAYPFTTLSTLEEVPTTDIGSFTTHSTITEFTRPAIEEKKETLFIESLKALQQPEPEHDIEKGEAHEEGEGGHHHPYIDAHGIHFGKEHPAEAQEGRKKALGIGEAGPGAESSEGVDPQQKIQEYLTKLECTPNGLSSAEAERRKSIYGSNSLPEVKESGILKFLGYMWNPLSWGMELAAIISVILVNWYDFILISALLLLNSSIGNKFTNTIPNL